MRIFVIISIFSLALIFGIVGLVDVLDSKGGSDNTQITKLVLEKEEYVTVWKSKYRLEVGDSVTPGILQKLEIPLTEALEFGIKKDIKLDFSPTTLLNTEVSSNQVVLPEYQVKPGTPGYIDLLVTKGMALYPLKLSNSQLINDYIRPGVNIDILSVSSPRLNLADRTDKPSVFKGAKASILLTGVKVLSVSGLSEDKNIDTITTQSTSKDGDYTTVVIEVAPDNLASLALAQRTTHIEIIRSQSYQTPAYAEVRDVIDNYTGIEELRGNETKPKEVL